MQEGRSQIGIKVNEDILLGIQDIEDVLQIGSKIQGATHQIGIKVKADIFQIGITIQEEVKGDIIQIGIKVKGDIIQIGILVKGYMLQIGIKVKEDILQFWDPRSRGYTSNGISSLRDVFKLDYC